MADLNPGQQGGAQAGQQQLKVNIPDEIKKGTYSNAVSVNVNSNEVVVDFGYLLPNTDQPEIEVVNRVNMNHKTAKSFLDVLKGAMEDFEKKQAEQNAKLADNKAADHVAPAAPAPHPAPAPGAPAPAGHAPAAPAHPAPPAPGMHGPVPPAHPAPAPPMPPLPENS